MSCCLRSQVIDYYREKGAVSDIQAGRESKQVTEDIRTVLKATADS